MGPTMGDMIQFLDTLIDGMKSLPASRGTSIAITHAETAKLWLVAVSTGDQS